MVTVDKHSRLEWQAFRAMEKALEVIPGSWSSDHPRTHDQDRGVDIVIRSPQGKKYCFQLKARSRLTPQIALTADRDFARLPKEVIPVVYAPAISPRVADILREKRIGYVDEAGNCWLASDQPPLLIHRVFDSLREARPVGRPRQPYLDLFAKQSSRIVRVMLETPLRGWKQRDLAAEAQVSLGLVVKAKAALISEGYALEYERRLYLRDPVALLQAWSGRYPAKASTVPIYLRGDVGTAEKKIDEWCRTMQAYESFDYALGGMSAAARLAPEVRYHVCNLYLDAGYDTDEALHELCNDLDAKRVDTGENCVIWVPADSSVFQYARELQKTREVITSPVQTYLDLIPFAGRGEEAASAVFNKHLKNDMERAAQRALEWQHGK